MNTQSSNIVSNTFNIHPRRKYENTSTKISLPIFLGDFSLDGNRIFHQTKVNLQHITIDWKDTKEVMFDLNQGIENVIRKDSNSSKDEKLTNFLKWIIPNLHKIQDYSTRPKSKPINKGSRLLADFLCYRGLLTTLLCTPYELREGWIICATKFRGTIYLFAYDSPEREMERQNQSERQNIMSSWGFKFEQFMNDGADVNLPVNEKEEYACVVQTTFGKFKLLYAAEVDAADRSLYSHDHTDLSSFVEYKTSKLPSNDRENRTLHKFKFIKWWSQSYMVGIPRIICGLRDNEGMVHKLKTYTVESLPMRAQEYWKPKIMLNFLTQFLEFIQSVVTEDDPRQMYKFTKETNSDIIVWDHYRHSAELNFLPDWYINKL